MGRKRAPICFCVLDATPAPHGPHVAPRSSCCTIWPARARDTAWSAATSLQPPPVRPGTAPGRSSTSSGSRSGRSAASPAPERLRGAPWSERQALGANPRRPQRGRRRSPVGHTPAVGTSRSRPKAARRRGQSACGPSPRAARLGRLERSRALVRPWPVSKGASRSAVTLLLLLGRRFSLLARRCARKTSKRVADGSRGRRRQDVKMTPLHFFALLPALGTDRMNGLLPHWSARSANWLRSVLGRWFSGAISYSSRASVDS